jgi:3-deoxy-7-phosphoheptulonate synthase
VVVDEVAFGENQDLVVMAGPCAIESKEQLEVLLPALSEMGITVVRGGAFKPRTSPHTFQGLGEEGLRLFRTMADRYGMRIVSEVMDTAQLEVVSRYAHLIQVGARSMYNTCLLKTLGSLKRPVLLKRGFNSRLDELLMAAEHIQQDGNRDILLCERGIRTFENTTRFTLDLSAVAVLKRRSEFPVVVDPSHAAGEASLVPDLAMAAVAAGTDALLIEVHPFPERALCDAKQALDINQLGDLVPRLQRIRAARQVSDQPGRKGISKTEAVQHPLT